MIALSGGAAGEEVSHGGDQAVEHEPDHADIDEGYDDVADPGGIPRIPDEEADADAADQHFSCYDGEPGQADADPEPGEHVRHGRRQHDPDKEFEWRKAQDAGDVAVVLRDVA